MFRRGVTKKRIGAVGTGMAMAGGLASEIGGQTAGGQEFEWGEIYTEAFAEKAFAMTGVTVLPTLLKKRRTYSINGQNFSEKDFIDITNQMSDVDVMLADINIENDRAQASRIYERQSNAIAESQIDERVTEDSDRKELVDLQKQFLELENQKKKKGIFKGVGVETKLEQVEMKINEILGKYEAVDRRTKEVRARKKVAQEVRSVYLEKTKSFAKVASEQMGFNPFESFKENNKFVSTLVERVMSLGKYNFDGVEVDLSTMTEDQIAAEANRIADSANQADAVNIPTADGNQAIMINEEAAFKYGALDAGSHEVLHGVMKGALNQMTNKERKILISQFKDQIKTNLGQKTLDLIDERLKKAFKSEKNRLLQNCTRLF